MKLRLKPLKDQIIVITGASSGIGLATARMAAKQGAKLVLAARSQGSLAKLAEELRSAGARCACVTADVTDPADVAHIAQTAIERFGGFDTWVNNAGVSIFGKLTEVKPEDHRRLFETNFWGVVHGSLEAVKHLRTHGGVLINMGSVASDRAVPLQGMYSATKHAVKAFTDALRMEVEHDKLPISVTLIKPTSINTPFPRHAKNYLGQEPTLPRPIYGPDVVARNILHAATRPVRDLIVGGAGKLISAMGAAPRVADVYMEATQFSQQQTDRPPAPDAHKSLEEPSEDLREEGDYTGHVMHSSAYTAAARNKSLVTTLLVLAGAALAAALFTQPDRHRAPESQNA